MNNLDNLLSWLGRFIQPFLLLVLRLFFGWQFFQTGMGKFEHIDQVIEYFATLGIPYPYFSAYLTAAVETIGGILLIRRAFHAHSRASPNDYPADCPWDGASKSGRIPF